MCLFLNLKYLNINIILCHWKSSLQLWHKRHKLIQTNQKPVDQRRLTGRVIGGFITIFNIGYVIFWQSVKYSTFKGLSELASELCKWLLLHHMTHV